MAKRRVMDAGSGSGSDGDSGIDVDADADGDGDADDRGGNESEYEKDSFIATCDDDDDDDDDDDYAGGSNSEGSEASMYSGGSDSATESANDTDDSDSDIAELVGGLRTLSVLPATPRGAKPPKTPRPSKPPRTPRSTKPPVTPSRPRIRTPLGPLMEANNGDSTDAWEVASGAITPLRTPAPKDAAKPSRATPRSTGGRRKRLGDDGLDPDRQEGPLPRTMKAREDLVRGLFKVFNTTVFDEKLPHDLLIEWSKTLRKTAGVFYQRKQGGKHLGRIELSTKVLDTRHKLAKTLLHELCHAAAWFINHAPNAGHGPIFKHWGSKAASLYSTLPVTTCHSYDIHYKHRYECERCFFTFGRHSNSVDVSRKACGKCGGTLKYLGTFNSDGTPMKKRALSGFSLFVKENYASVKGELGKATHAEIFRELGARWKSRASA